MKYIVLVPSNVKNLGSSVSNNDHLGGSVELAAQSLAWLHDVGFEKQLRNLLESDDFKRQVTLELINNQGVLAQVDYEEAKPQVVDFKEFKERRCPYLFIIGSGSDAYSVLRKYLANGTLSRIAPDGWVLKSMYVWITEIDKPDGFYYDKNPSSIDKILKTA